MVIQMTKYIFLTYTYVICTVLGSQLPNPQNFLSVENEKKKIKIKE